MLRIGLGVWWVESFRHKDQAAWFKRGAGISWGQSVAEKHKWTFVKTGFDTVVASAAQGDGVRGGVGRAGDRPGLILGFLTPIAAFAGILLNIMYFILMISDWAEQGQNFMMILAPWWSWDPRMERVVDRPLAAPLRGVRTRCGGRRAAVLGVSAGR